MLKVQFKELMFSTENSHEFSASCAHDFQNPTNQFVEIKHQTLTEYKWHPKFGNEGFCKYQG